MTGTSCQTGGREETLSLFFVASFLLFPSCLSPTTTLGSPSSLLLFPTSLNVSSPSPTSSSALCLVVTLLNTYLLFCRITFSVSDINLQDEYESSNVFLVQSQSLKYQIWQMSNEQTSDCKSVARLVQTYREHCLVSRGCQ